jgi:nicotinamidase-related amidase
MLSFHGRQIPETLAEIVHPGHTVVMVHDMQNDNTGKGGKYDQIGRRIDVTAIIPPIADFLGRARAAGCKVMYTQYTNLPDFASWPDPRLRDSYRTLQDPAQRDGLDALVQGTWGWKTIPELAPRPGEPIIHKFRVDAFIGTPFEYLLRINRIRTIVHTGIATEVGILPTAWHALNMGFFVVVPEDCVGAMQPQYHGEAMAFLRRLAILTRSADVVAAWRSTDGGTERA